MNTRFKHRLQGTQILPHIVEEFCSLANKKPDVQKGCRWRGIVKVAANSAFRLSSGRISTFLSCTRQNASSLVQTGSRRQWTAFSAAILQWALNRGSSSPWHKFKYRRLVSHVFKQTNKVGLTGWKTLWMSSNSLARQRKPTKYSLPYTSRWLAYVLGPVWVFAHILAAQT